MTWGIISCREGFEKTAQKPIAMMFSWSGLWFALGWLLACLWWGMWARMLLASKRVELLRNFDPDPDPPGLSIVVAAANEEHTLERALRSLLALDYPEVEVIVVNDRSTDGTGAVLAKLAEQHPRLQVVTLTELPPGWLGKTHALHQGAARARHDLLLFTDADVVFAPDSLRRAVTALKARNLDHLVVAPHMEAHGLIEQVFISYFNVMFQVRFQPDRAQDPKSKAFIGVGAFNMVRRQAYRAVGGHLPVALDVTDDVSLGRALKLAGFRQQVFNGMDLVHVRWVVGLRGIIHGLEKNAYAGVDYDLPKTVMAGGILLFIALGPALLSFTPGGVLAWLGMCATGTLSGPMMGLPRTCGPLFPLAGPLFIYVVARSAWLAERRGGIYWRGTFYRLEELRAFLRARDNDRRSS